MTTNERDGRKRSDLLSWKKKRSSGNAAKPDQIVRTGSCSFMVGHVIMGGLMFVNSQVFLKRDFGLDQLCTSINN